MENLFDSSKSVDQISLIFEAFLRVGFIIIWAKTSKEGLGVAIPSFKFWSVDNTAKKDLSLIHSDWNTIAKAIVDR